MKQKELIDKIQDKLNGASKKQIKAFLDATEQVVEETVQNNERIKLFSFMDVYGERIPAKEWRNPARGCMVKLPEHTYPRVDFKRSFKVKVR